jgi:hypothetical protein
MKERDKRGARRTAGPSPPFAKGATGFGMTTRKTKDEERSFVRRGGLRMTGMQQRKAHVTEFSYWIQGSDV